MRLLKQYVFNSSEEIKLGGIYTTQKGKGLLIKHTLDHKWKLEIFRENITEIRNQFPLPFSIAYVEPSD